MLTRLGGSRFTAGDTEKLQPDRVSRRGVGVLPDDQYAHISERLFEGAEHVLARGQVTCTRRRGLAPEEVAHLLDLPGHRTPGPRPTRSPSRSCSGRSAMRWATTSAFGSAMARHSTRRAGAIRCAQGLSAARAGGSRRRHEPASGTGPVRAGFPRPGPGGSRRHEPASVPRFRVARQSGLSIGPNRRPAGTGGRLSTPAGESPGRAPTAAVPYPAAPYVLVFGRRAVAAGRTADIDSPPDSPPDTLPVAA